MGDPLFPRCGGTLPDTAQELRWVQSPAEGPGEAQRRAPWPLYLCLVGTDDLHDRAHPTDRCYQEGVEEGGHHSNQTSGGWRVSPAWFRHDHPPQPTPRAAAAGAIWGRGCDYF